MAIMPPLAACQPKKGTESSSRFSTKEASGRKAKGPMKSNRLWCLAATRAWACGRFSSPRTSVLTPPSHFRPNTITRAHIRTASIIAWRGASSSTVKLIASGMERPQNQMANRTARSLVTDGPGRATAAAP